MRAAVVRRTAGGTCGGAAVAARVHRGGQRDRALQRALQDRQSDLEQAAQAPVGAAAQPAGGAQPLDVGDQMRREGHRDDHRDARLVQRARAAT